VSRHHAPSVSYPVGRSRFLGVCLALWGVGVAVASVQLTALTGKSVQTVDGLWAAAGCMVLISLLLWRQWWITPVGWLTWDPPTADELLDGTPTGDVASGWWWSPDSECSTHLPIGAPVVVLDLGSHMALSVPCVQPSSRGRLWFVPNMTCGHPVWIWVDARMHADRWLPLRRALRPIRVM